jgi:hypothetical protein
MVFVIGTAKRAAASKTLKIGGWALQHVMQSEQERS